MNQQLLRVIGFSLAAMALVGAVVYEFASHKSRIESEELFPIVTIVNTNATPDRPLIVSPSLLPKGADLAILKYYAERVHDYCFWAELHKVGYWIFVFLSVACGLALVICMSLKQGDRVLLWLALSLNALLVLNQAIGSDKKYPRYRMAQTQLQMECQTFQVKVACEVANGTNEQQAVFDNLEQFHTNMITIINAETDDFFKNVQSINDLKQQLDALRKQK